jgi:DMSO/TMAO reductase YedYZ heme-binding membrane subunit
LKLVWPWQDRNRRFSWLKASTFAPMLLPAIRSAYLVGTEDYGTLSPVVLGGLTYWSGVWATVILLVALAVTPAVTIFRWPALTMPRRC